MDVGGICCNKSVSRLDTFDSNKWLWFKRARLVQNHTSTQGQEVTWMEHAHRLPVVWGDRFVFGCQNVTSLTQCLHTWCVCDKQCHTRFANFLRLSPHYKILLSCLHALKLFKNTLSCNGSIKKKQQ